jgi:uncharacterized protein (TIGR01777 family)
MRVFVTGASGLIGTHLCRALLARGDEVVALSRVPRAGDPNMVWVRGSESSLAQWQGALSGCQAVVNLAGESVARRWSNAHKARIIRSRVGMTTALYHAMAQASEPPRVLVSGSAVGFYGTDPEATFDETSPRGEGFLATVCEEWERAASRAETLEVRVVRLRIGVVLAREGGALPAVLRPIRAYLGGALGTGKQWLSWIHVEDLVRLILFCLDNADIDGAVNGVAPEPIGQRDLVRAIAKVVGRPVWMDAPTWALRLVLGQMADEMLLAGQRVLPTRARTAGFVHVHGFLDQAIGDLLAT